MDCEIEKNQTVYVYCNDMWLSKYGQMTYLQQNKNC